MNPYLLLAFAISAEVTATLALKAADGLTKPLPTIVVVLGYGTAFWLMSNSMNMLPIGIVYAIWAGGRHGRRGGRRRAPVPGADHPADDDRDRR